ncbi:MAG TPA: cysteine--tRNA ligase [Chloroflexia bacterium]|nr:cysteine--tRNA ligase [Chloroflexia bacterium]
MKIYNTLTRKVEEIVPVEPGKISIYTCGPTVYRYIHIGNLRTFTMADWLRRAFLYRGYEVRHIKNITDVGHMRVEMLDRGEDKLIAQARKEGKTSAEIAAFYTQAFMQDEASLNILPADVFPRATQHVAEMLDIVEGLLEKGTAYEVEGNVYFDVSKFPQYGKLSGNLLENMLEGVRGDTDPKKHSAEDFALWKLAEPGREMAWDSPWGRGFPGWHIECSAMSIKYLGKHFDLHTGGVDNIFPHHEDEIAQSEGWTGQQFVNYWVHAQHLLADGLKMAKSTGNAYTRADVEARGFDPLALRYFYTTALYRSRINFTFGALTAAQTALERLRGRAVVLQEAGGQRYKSDGAACRTWTEKFLAAIENDLNMPQAMAVVWNMLRSPADDLSPRARLDLLLDWDRILGFNLSGYLESGSYKLAQDSAESLRRVSGEIAQLVRTRAEERARGNYAAADAIRKQVEHNGFSIRDTRQGPLVEPRPMSREFSVLTSSNSGPDNTAKPSLYDFSINLLAQNSRSDLERCVNSIARYAGGRSIELVIVDNGSTDDTLPYLQQLAREGIKDEKTGEPLALQVLFADHNMGFAAGRNATFRASLGRYILMLDTSIELKGDIWTPLETSLSDSNVGLVGPYGLLTTDLKEFYEPKLQKLEPVRVDAIEGYLMAFRREQLSEVFPIDEKFRFYRMMDVYFSFFFKTAGFEVLALPAVANLLEKYPHREWYSLTEEEQQTKSKKNYDIFRERWHHGQSLLATNFNPQERWGHDDKRHVAGDHTHSPPEMPAPGQPHSHKHQHWPDHDHEHPHYHAR